MGASTYDEEDFWGEVIRKTGSNSASEGWESLKRLIQSGDVSTSSLWGIHSALRSLSQECQNQISERRAIR